MGEKHWKRAYGALQTGDPKMRETRGWALDVLSDSAKQMKSEKREKEG